MNQIDMAKHAKHTSPITGFGSLPSFGNVFTDVEKQSL